MKHINKTWIAAGAMLLLTACVNMETTRIPDNATAFHLNANYQAAYRIIDENLKMCQGIDAVHSTIYPDQNRANINFGMHNVVAFSLDLSDDGKAGTDAVFYTAFKAQKEYVDIFSAWVNDGKRGCNMRQIGAAES